MDGAAPAPGGAAAAAPAGPAPAAPAVRGLNESQAEAVLADPQLINRSPYPDGWLIELHPTNWETEAPLLVSGDGIAEWARESENRPAEEAENGE